MTADQQEAVDRVLEHDGGAPDRDEAGTEVGIDAGGLKRGRRSSGDPAVVPLVALVTAAGPTRTLPIGHLRRLRVNPHAPAQVSVARTFHELGASDLFLAD